MRLKHCLAILGAVLVAGCQGTTLGSTTPPVTVLGYSVQTATPPPATALIGSNVAMIFRITEHESDGTSKPASGVTFTVTITAGGGTVGGGVSLTLTSGADGSVPVTWTMGAGVGLQVLRAAVSTTEILDVSVMSTPIPAAQLAIVTQPSPSATPGSTFVQQPTIQVKDVNGANFAQAGIAVTVSLASGGGTLQGTSTLGTNASGSVTFTNLAVTGIVGTVTLRFSATLAGSSASVTSQPVTIATSQLVLSTPPAASAISGVALSRQPAVQLEDAAGANIAQAGILVTASIRSGSGTVSGGAIASTDSTGLASFATLGVTGLPGTVTLRFSATVNSLVISVASLDIVVSASPQLVLVTGPSSAPNSGLPMYSQPVAQLQDGLGNAVHQGGVPVTVNLASGAGSVGIAAGGTGSLTVLTDANGQAAFHDLALTGFGDASLRFTASGYIEAMSANLVVTGLPTVTTLSNSVQLGPFVVGAGDLMYYTFVLPAGTLSMDIATFGGTGNAELYVRRGLNPTAADFDCHAGGGGPSQLCTFGSNLGGTFYVIVRATTSLAGSRIRANAYDANCASRGVVTLGTPVIGMLSPATACTVDLVQRPHDRYTLTIPTTQAVSFTASSASNVDQIGVAWRLPDMQVNYTSSGFGTTPGGLSQLILGPGTYTVMAMDYGPAGPLVTRQYSMTWTATPAQPTGCSFLFPYGPLSVALNLTATDCGGTTPGTKSQRAFIVLSAGQTVTITMASAAFDPYLKVLSGGNLTPAATILASDDNSGGGTTARVVFTNSDATNNAQFTIELTSPSGAATGAYTLSLAYAPAYYNVRAPGTGAATAPSSGPVRGTARP